MYKYWKAKIQSDENKIKNVGADKVALVWCRNDEGLMKSVEREETWHMLVQSMK